MTEREDTIGFFLYNRKKMLIMTTSELQVVDAWWISHCLN